MLHSFTMYLDILSMFADVFLWTLKKWHIYSISKFHCYCSIQRISQNIILSKLRFNASWRNTMRRLKNASVWGSPCNMHNNTVPIREHADVFSSWACFDGSFLEGVCTKVWMLLTAIAMVSKLLLILFIRQYNIAKRRFNATGCCYFHFHPVCISMSS